jgi:hypothetical protein
MRHLHTVALAATLGLLAVTSGAASTSPRPKTLASSSGPIYAFAQSSAALAWIGGDARVRMQRLPGGKSSVVGRIAWPERAFGSWLAISGTRVVWAWDSGGNSNETSIVTGGLGVKQSPVRYLNGGGRNVGNGQRFSGLGGDPSTLAFGWVDERCDLPFGICELCEPLDSCSLVVAGGGVSIVTAGAKPTLLPGITPPALFALAEGRVALAPARSPTLERGPVPRVVEDGPVEVFDLSGRHLTTIPLMGLVRGIAMTGQKVTVLLERPEGDRQILRFDARSGKFLSGSPLLSPAASSLATGTGGIVFRVGRQIYLPSGRKLVPVARAASTPIGLSIEGRRVAWAENVHGKGRIRAVTIP